MRYRQKCTAEPHPQVDATPRSIGLGYAESGFTDTTCATLSGRYALRPRLPNHAYLFLAHTGAHAAEVSVLALATQLSHNQVKTHPTS